MASPNLPCFPIPCLRSSFHHPPRPSMSSHDTGLLLDEEDVRALVRLLGEAAAMDSTDEQRLHVMRGLSTLVQADAWVWGLAPLLRPGEQPVYLFRHTNGFDEARMTRFLKALEHPDTGAMTAPLAEAMIAAQGRVTRELGRIVSAERYQASPARAFWEAADIGPLVLSVGPVPETGASIVGFYRRLGAPAFSPREARMMHIMLTEMPWLHEVDMPHAAARNVPRLSPRQRIIINQLVSGYSRKSIASELGVTENTIHGHARDIYRHFDVHSQAELVARFTRGDGKDG
ncbi:MAG: LuxR family transcriptional regulator [Verrucomicrobiaceae bacterium]|nr:MAG: LuxR family transcriptional regulator [Verrucomicrobiaceae bacterium]